MDHEIIEKIEKTRLNLPILLGGGAGNEIHVANILKSNSIQGIVASSMFTLTQSTPTTIRKYCEDLNISMRKI